MSGSHPGDEHAHGEHDHSHHQHSHGEHAHSHHDHHAHGEHDHAHQHHGQHSHSHGKVTLLPGNPEAHRESLERGAGARKLLFIDPWCGIAGDMTVAALVDLGVPFAVVEEALAALGIEAKGRVQRADTSGIGATHFSVDAPEDQPHRPYAVVRRMLASARLRPGVRALAERIFERLAHAEARVHRVPLDEVTFHEVGSVDSLFDIVGAAAAFEFLGAAVVSGPVPLGHGHVHTAHGVLPVPAPATLECLRDVPTLAADIDFENVTPTGAAILATVAERFESWAAQRPERIGWGAGTRAVAGRPNALRVVLGEPAAVAKDTAELVVLEANVDDMTGELAAHAISALIRAGALDAWATAITMKKGRPALMLSALVRAAAADELTGVLLTETTSLGVRRVAMSRTERPRRIVEVTTRFGTIPLKVGEGPYGAPQAKPEFDACESAAASAGVPVREVIAEALAAWARAAR